MLTAIETSEGLREFKLNGVTVSEQIALTAAEDLTMMELLMEKNADVRREIVRKIGIKRICAELHAQVVDEKLMVYPNIGVPVKYRLLMLDIGDGRKRPYLEMENPSEKKRGKILLHIEGVHLSCKTVEQAMEFRKGNGVENYMPFPNILT